MGLIADAIAGTRYLVIVRRGEEATYRYLSARLANLRGVDVVLDRRAAPSPAPARDRRREPARFNTFGVLLVRR